MSQALIDAVLSGNINGVEALLKNHPSIDVNFIGKMRLNQVSLCEVSCTALSAATTIGHFEIVKLLLERGAEVDPVISGAGYPLVNALVGHCTGYYSSAPKKVRNIGIFIILLQNTTNINPEFPTFISINMNATNLFDLLDPEIGQRACRAVVNTISGYRDKLIPYLFFEAIIRNNGNLIEKMLAKFPDLFSNFQSFHNYLDTRELTSSQATHTLKCILSFAEKGLITIVLRDSLITSIKKKIIYSVQLDNFPELLHAELKERPKLDLIRLFAQFRNLICPEEHLPSLPVTSLQPIELSLYALGEETIPQALERIRYKQNPAHLSTLISLDVTEIIFRLYNCNTPHGSNDAVVLLAQMLLYKHSEQVTLEQKSFPLLNQDEQQTCFYILNKFFALTDSEKLSMNCTRRQRQEIEDLRRANDEQSTEVSDLKSQVALLTTQVKDLNDKMDLILRQINQGHVGQLNTANGKEGKKENYLQGFFQNELKDQATPLDKGSENTKGAH